MVLQNSLRGWCGFSSQVDSKSSVNEDDSEDLFFELESPPHANLSSLNVSENESISESELSEEEKVAADEESHNGLLLSDTEEHVIEKKTPKKRVSQALFNAIMEASATSVQRSLDKWVEDGKELKEDEIYTAMTNLRRRNMYGRALQLSEWLETSKHIEFGEKDYATRVDLIAKVRGLPTAESYIDKIPKSFRTEVVYRTLLANCVSTTNVKNQKQCSTK